MDNQQATLMTTALFLGEGHFILLRNQNGRGGLQYHTEIGFTNKDAALLDFICGWLEANEIPHFIAACTGAFQIKVQRYGAIKKMIDILEPYMFGQKLHEARLLRRFVERRLVRGNGKTGDNAFRRYGPEDEALYKERRTLRGSPETTRAPACWQNHRHLPPKI